MCLMAMVYAMKNLKPEPVMYSIWNGTIFYIVLVYTYAFNCNMHAVVNIV